MATETVETETQSTDASTDMTVIIPITGAIYHNDIKKPTETWCFELGIKVATDKDFTSASFSLQKGFGIKEKCAMLNIVKFKIQLSSKDFQPRLPFSRRVSILYFMIESAPYGFLFTSCKTLETNE